MKVFKGNNRAKPYVKGKMVLFLNPDTIVYKDVFAKTVRYLEEHPKVGAVTCKLVLSDGSMDKDIRRKFPTPRISFNKLVLGKTREYYYEYIQKAQLTRLKQFKEPFSFHIKNFG